MVGSLRFAAAAAFSILMSACASTPDNYAVNYPRERDARAPDIGGVQVETPEQRLQCVPFARMLSGINIFGDAGSWWDQAAGRYERSNEPKLGAVLVLTGYAGPHRGHVAVVTAVESSREIRVDHANWLNDGKVYRGDPIFDVSQDNDWSEVRVWNPRDNVMGVRTYLVQGFIGPGGEEGGDRVASLP
jgi:hypothetical protein